MKVSKETMVVEGRQVLIRRFRDLPEAMREAVAQALAEFDLGLTSADADGATLTVPRYVTRGSERHDIAAVLGRTLGYQNPKRLARDHRYRAHRPRSYPVRLNFEEIDERAKAFAASITSKQEDVIQTLLPYESFQVATDEIARTIDLLTSLRENATYFRRRIGAVATFLPLNQPLYALGCFAIVPCLMASEVHVRPPLAMGRLLIDLAHLLELQEHFPEVHISAQQRSAFVRQHAPLRETEDGRTEPVTDAVIFTGKMQNADRLREVFDRRTLLIANGSGHNPIVVTETADVGAAVTSALRTQLHNAGQDCTNANTILVHTRCLNQFTAVLRGELSQVHVGPYTDRRNTVGPLTDRGDLERLQKLLAVSAEWLDPNAEGVIRTKAGILEPTIILKPLRCGGNYDQHFAPIFFVQECEEDAQLKDYFENPRYAANAMYVTVFGESPYVDTPTTRCFPGGRALHDETTVLHNVDLHASGVERGTQPYGDYGRGASCVSLEGRVTAMPTCPQRDIYQLLVVPYLAVELGGSCPV